MIHVLPAPRELHVECVDLDEALPEVRAVILYNRSHEAMLVGWAATREAAEADVRQDTGPDRWTPFVLQRRLSFEIERQGQEQETRWLAIGMVDPGNLVEIAPARKPGE